MTGAIARSGWRTRAGSEYLFGGFCISRCSRLTGGNSRLRSKRPSPVKEGGPGQPSISRPAKSLRKPPRMLQHYLFLGAAAVRGRGDAGKADPIDAQRDAAVASTGTLAAKRARHLTQVKCYRSRAASIKSSAIVDGV